MGIRRVLLHSHSPVAWAYKDSILKRQCHLRKIFDMICGPLIPKTTVKIPKEIFFHPKNLNFDEISCASCYQTALPRKDLVTKGPYLGKNLVTKWCYPEQTLLPNGVTRNKPYHQTTLPRKEPFHQTALPRKEPCHQTASPGKNLVTKWRHPERTLSPNGVT